MWLRSLRSSAPPSPTPSHRLNCALFVGFYLRVLADQGRISSEAMEVARKIGRSNMLAILGGLSAVVLVFGVLSGAAVLRAVVAMDN